MRARTYDVTEPGVQGTAVRVVRGARCAGRRVAALCIGRTRSVVRASVAAQPRPTFSA